MIPWSIGTKASGDIDTDLPSITSTTIGAALQCDTIHLTKIRRRSDLGLLCGPKNYVERTILPSQTGYWIEERGIPCGVEISKHKRAMTASSAARLRFTEDPASTVVDDIDWTEPVAAGAMASSRRSATAFLFSVCYNSPPPEEWHGVRGAITRVRRRLRIPIGSSELIANIFENARREEMGGTSYDNYVGCTRRLRLFTIADNSAEAGLVISILEAGAGMTKAAVLVNEHRAKQAPGPHSEPIS
jgi:hypothetical protein